MQQPTYILDPDPLSSLNGMPFAAYADPVGFAQLCAMKAPDARSFRKRCPVATAVADSMSEWCPKTFWGVQGPRFDGDTEWVYRTAGAEATGRNGNTYLTKVMTANDVLGSLCRRDKNAVGCRDGGSTTVIRIDVDVDPCSLDTETLADAETACRRAGDSLGLPCAFRTTGGSGVGADYRLPERLDHGDAVRVRDALRLLLSDALPRGTKLDVDSLSSLMRLPLMLNAKTGRLGLYVHGGVVLPVQEQAHLASLAFVPTGGDVQRLLDACDEVLGHAEPAEPEETPERVHAPGRSVGRHHGYWESVRASRPEPGRFWEWVSDRDVRYAFAWLYGHDGAKAELRRIADEVPCASEAERRKRYEKIDWCIDSLTIYGDGSRRVRTEPALPVGFPAEVHELDEMAAEEVFAHLLHDGRRGDACLTAWRVARAYCHALRHLGHADGKDVQRVCELLYGNDAPTHKTVTRSLPPHFIVLTFSDSKYVAGGYTLPEAWLDDPAPAGLTEGPEHEDLDQPVQWEVLDAITELVVAECATQEQENVQQFEAESRQGARRGGSRPTDASCPERRPARTGNGAQCRSAGPVAKMGGQTAEDEQCRDRDAQDRDRGALQRATLDISGAAGPPRQRPWAQPHADWP